MTDNRFVIIPENRVIRHLLNSRWQGRAEAERFVHGTWNRKYAFLR